VDAVQRSRLLPHDQLVLTSPSPVSLFHRCLGELASWFVGWNLTLEYAISAAVVARTWSSNLALFINNIGGNYPTWLDTYDVGGPLTNISPMSAVICVICTCILLIGVKESSNMNIFITTLNMGVILFIIILGSFHVDTNNWTAPDPADGPDAPHTWFPKGVNGIVTGAAVVFFSYIGFDSVTTLAEEVKNPKRDLPIGIIATLIISTILYVATTIVVTGMQPWYELQNDQTPLATAFQSVGLKWASTLISAATVTALTGNTLTSLFGQPRIFYRMAKDGLLFQQFAQLHPKTKAPLWGTIYTGIAAALIAFLIPLGSLANMIMISIDIGTLLAFSTSACAGVDRNRQYRCIWQNLTISSLHSDCWNIYSWLPRARQTRLAQRC
jgi:amino acid transporter